MLTFCHLFLGSTGCQTAWVGKHHGLVVQMFEVALPHPPYVRAPGWETATLISFLLLQITAPPFLVCALRYLMGSAVQQLSGVEALRAAGWKVWVGFALHMCAFVCTRNWSLQNFWRAPVLWNGVWWAEEETMEIYCPWILIMRRSQQRWWVRQVTRQLLNIQVAKVNNLKMCSVQKSVNRRVDSWILVHTSWWSFMLSRSTRPTSTPLYTQREST